VLLVCGVGAVVGCCSWEVVVVVVVVGVCVCVCVCVGGVGVVVGR